MAGLFSSPSVPRLPKPIEPPVVDQTLIGREAQDLARRRKGSAANILAGDAAVPSSSLAVKQLLGS